MMRTAGFLNALLLVALLTGCGSDGSSDTGDGAGGDGADGDGAGDDGSDGDGAAGDDTGAPEARVSVCELLPAADVGEITGDQLVTTAMDNELVSTCFYDSEEETLSVSVRLEYDGASNYEASRDAVESLGGTSEDVSGVGDAALHHYYVQEFGGFTSAVSTFMVKHEDALVSVTVGDIDLSSDVGRQRSEELARLTLMRLDAQ